MPKAETDEALPGAVAAMSEPMTSHDVVAFYLLSREVSKSIKVVQSGQGADEVLGGYDWYPPIARVGREGALDAYHKRSSTARTTRSASWSRRSPSSRTPSLDFVARALRAPGADDAVDAALRLDTTVMLVDDPVKRVDNMTMAWGLEARVPFLDHDFVETMGACPPDFKMADGGKGVLKAASRGVLPDEIIDRKKGYFPVPAIRQLSGPVLERVTAALTDPAASGGACSGRTRWRRCSTTPTRAGPTSAPTHCGRSHSWRCGCRPTGSADVGSRALRR